MTKNIMLQGVSDNPLKYQLFDGTFVIFEPIIEFDKKIVEPTYKGDPVTIYLVEKVVGFKVLQEVS